MAEPEHRTLMTEFYARIAEFMSNMPEISDEFSYEEAFLKDLNMPDESKRNLVFNWYIFDHKSKVLSKNFLEYFVEKSKLDKETKALYGGFKNNICSIFEIKSIRTGKEMIAHDILSGKNYNIKDSTLTKNIVKGQLVIMRVLTFKDNFILTGMAYAFPLKSSHILKLSLLNAKDFKKPGKLTPLMICKMFYQQEKPEKLPPRDHFRLICKECNLEDRYIDEIIQRTKERVENKGDFYDIQKEFISRLRPHANFDMNEVTKAYIDLWNSFIKGFVAKGPVETALIAAGMTYVQQKVKPKRYKDDEKASAKAEKVFEEWLHTPHDELEGRTPEELIFEEREELGNPEKRIKFRINITGLAPGEEIKIKAEETVNKAIRLLNENKPKEAIESYKEHIAICPKNHIAWQNMGLAYILLCDRENAERCFRKALKIDPTYKVAKNNLKVLENSTQADIKRMSEDFRVQIVNKNKRNILNIEDMYEDTI